MTITNSVKRVFGPPQVLFCEAAHSALQEARWSINLIDMEFVGLRRAERQCFGAEGVAPESGDCRSFCYRPGFWVRDYPIWLIAAEQYLAAVAIQTQVLWRAVRFEERRRHEAEVVGQRLVHAVEVLGEQVLLGELREGRGAERRTWRGCCSIRRRRA